MDKELTLKEVAEKYNITVTAVRYWLNTGLPWAWESQRQIGKRRRIVVKEGDLEKWLKS